MPEPRVKFTSKLIFILRFILVIHFHTLYLQLFSSRKYLKSNCLFKNYVGNTYNKYILYYLFFSRFEPTTPRELFSQNFRGNSTYYLRPTCLTYNLFNL